MGIESGGRATSSVAEGKRWNTASETERLPRRNSRDDGALKWLEDKISSEAWRREREYAETREGLELERVVSCRCGDERRRTKLDLGSGEPLHDHHWPTTLGAAPKVPGVR